MRRGSLGLLVMSETDPPSWLAKGWFLEQVCIILKVEQPGRVVDNAQGLGSLVPQSRAAAGVGQLSWAVWRRSRN